MSTVAFVGLGVMGGPMAAHLVAAGHDVVGVNRSRAAVERLVAAGGRGAASVAAAVRDAAVVITMLPDGPDVELVSLGEQGIHAHAPAGALHVDCSTIRPDTARALAASAARRGLGFVDAPVSGGEVGAREATLSVMAGGSAADVAAARPVLEAVAARVVHVGDTGAGQTVKAANQLVVAGTLQLVAEALVFLDAHDVDLDAAVDVLAGGLAGSRVLDLKARGMIGERFEPGFRVDLHHKDLGIALAAAREAGVATPLGVHVASLLAALRARGHGGLDHSALLLLVQELSGRR
ncbi:NAD(P)-dependent oxidoreductase [Patulibacter sp. S7RM1-6]